MTRARDRITKVVEGLGWKVDGEMEWEPIGAAAEKSGPSGGWFVQVVCPCGEKDFAVGLSWLEVVEHVNCFLDPCSGSPPHGMDGFTEYLAALWAERQPDGKVKRQVCDPGALILWDIVLHPYTWSFGWNGWKYPPNE